MVSVTPFAVAIALVVIGSAASACAIWEDERSISEIRSLSKPVAVDRQCRAINAGVFDNLSLRRADNLGQGRVQQVLDGRDASLVLLADCNTREVTMLRGAATMIGETSCGPDYSYADLSGEKATMSLASGDDLNDLVDLATAQGATEINPVTFFFTFQKDWDAEEHPVGRKDRFDLLCGCKLFYPDSPGAQN